MKDIVEILKKEFNSKLENNPHYSLRAFAMFLGISPAGLSRILSGQMQVTPKVFQIISHNLNLTPIQHSQIMKGLQLKKQNENIRNIDLPEMNAIEMEQFNLISDWYHYAILHMCSLDDFNKDPGWIARRLGISDVEVIKEAIARLLEFKHMGVDENQNYYKIDQFTVVMDYSYSSHAMRERQKQILALSAQKLDAVPMHLRDHSTITLPVDLQQLPEIKERIKKFRRTLGNYIVKNNQNSKQVYELQISFFPLLEIES